MVKEGARRARWPLASVEQVLSPFLAVIRLNGKLTRRATNLLYPLEAEPPWEGLPSLSVNNSSKDDHDSPFAPSDHKTELRNEAKVSRKGRAINLPARLRDYEY